MVIIKILTGSVRPGRFNIQPANWIRDIAMKRKDITVDFVDLAEVNLPFLDEPASPKQRKYTKDYTKQWSKRIEEGDGFIFVTPEYNHGVSPVLKNAIDFLWHEWNYKPVAYVSYGSEAGGARSVEHLRGIAAETKMYDLRDQMVLSNYWNHLDENGTYLFTEEHEKHANLILDELIFWSEHMKEARKKLQNTS